MSSPEISLSETDRHDSTKAVSSARGGTATAYADADADAETLDRWSRKHTTDKPCGRRTWRDAPAPPLHAVLSTAARRAAVPRARC
uniref:Uncharacterized protein n=1 Tax=Oryza sativa subsp. japonica TaxID=39947 RepID=Q6ZAK3_ORYSJ|nr:hypothetical protein [Oryza sativa Japonica Group]